MPDDDVYRESVRDWLDERAAIARDEQLTRDAIDPDPAPLVPVIADDVSGGADETAPAELADCEACSSTGHCVSCDGTGECEECDGTGEYLLTTGTAVPGECNVCSGTGHCTVCDNTGECTVCGGS